MDLSTRVEIAERACRRAGESLIQNFGKAHASLSKHDHYNVVTEADKASEEILIRNLREAFPHDSILSEEAGFQQGSTNDCWILDPLDGTSNYVAGIPWFGVLVAHLVDGVPDLGLVYLPAFEDMYVARKAGGSFRNGVRVRVTREGSLKNVLWSHAMDDPGTDTGRLEVLRALLKAARNVRATNCLVDAAYTADGRFGGFLNWSCRVWDVAAPSLVISEAGGIYTDVHGGALNFESLSEAVEREYSVLAGAPVLHAEVLKMLEAKLMCGRP